MSEPTTNTVSGRSRSLERLLWVILGLVLAGQLVTLTGRGAMTPDSYVYVGMAESARAGSGFLFDGRTMRWPPGYPAILATLMELGAGTSFAFRAVNFCAVVAGLGILLARFEKRGLPRVWQLSVALLILLSLPVLYSVNFVLSDCVFFLACVVTIELLERAREATAGRRLALLALALVAVVLASLVRSAGLTLVPALLATAIWNREGGSSRGGRWLLLGATLLAGFLVAAWMDSHVLKTGYVSEARRHFEGIRAQRGLVGTLTKRSVTRLTGTGQFVVNLQARGRERLNDVFLIAGVIGAILLAKGLAAGKDPSRPVELFTISYLGMMFLYPAFAHRYWLPVLPQITCLVALWASARLNRSTRLIAVLFVIVYCALGVRILSWHFTDAVRSTQPLGERLLAPAPSHR